MPLGSLFPSEVFTAQSATSLDKEQIFPEEWALVEGAVAKRQAEFCGGRISAHLALEQLGIGRGPILSNEDRSPIWPIGVVGSISHTRDFCCAAVCKKGKIVGIGLDVESASPIEEKLIRRICTDREREWLGRQPWSNPGTLAKLLFCIKEAAYKCQYPITRQFIEFHQAEVEIDSDQHSFQVVIHGDKNIRPIQQPPIGGRYAITGGHILAGAIRKIQASRY